MSRLKLRCQWFGGCNRPATGTTSHPLLGEVPTCDRCHIFAKGQERGSAAPTMLLPNWLHRLAKAKPD